MMNITRSVLLSAVVIALLPASRLLAADVTTADNTAAAPEKIVGLYVHQHWPYNHPYASRTWSLEDWAGYIDGVHQLGYNTIQLWPVIETMPNPLTESDREYLDKCRQIIDLIHAKNMKVILSLCPNVVADDAVAGQATFEERVFFFSDVRVNPGNKDAVAAMIKRREELFRPLSKVDAVAIIDSDPGGYPGSTIEEFVGLFDEHRKMFDRLRPGIELLYWIHVGWPGYCRYYDTGELQMSTEAEYDETLRQMNELNPAPWGLAGNIAHANRVGMADRAIDYRYGLVEGEPTIPLTNFGSDRAYEAAKEVTGRGVMSNAQTHCLQLPYIFAFAQGANGKPLTSAEYVEFANRLLPGHGEAIVAGWSALGQTDPAVMLAEADKLESLAKTELTTGSLKGLLFNDPQRFITDIVMQLRLRAAGESFIAASAADGDVSASFGEFAKQFAAWQQQHGYRGRAVWEWPNLTDAISKLNSPEINAVLKPHIEAPTPFAKVKEDYEIAESATLNLADAMNATAIRLQKTNAAKP